MFKHLTSINIKRRRYLKLQTTLGSRLTLSVNFFIKKSKTTLKTQSYAKSSQVRFNKSYSLSLSKTSTPTNFARTRLALPRNLLNLNTNAVICYQCSKPSYYKGDCLNLPAIKEIDIIKQKLKADNLSKEITKEDN